MLKKMKSIPDGLNCADLERRESLMLVEDTADDAIVVATTNLLATIIHSDNDVAGRGLLVLEVFFSVPLLRPLVFFCFFMRGG